MGPHASEPAAFPTPLFFVGMKEQRARGAFGKRVCELPSCRLHEGIGATLQKRSPRPRRRRRRGTRFRDWPPAAPPTEPSWRPGAIGHRYCVPRKQAPARPAASRLGYGRWSVSRATAAAAGGREGKRQPCRVPVHARDMGTATGAASLRDARLVPCLSSSGRRLEWKNERFTSSAR